MGLDVAHDVAAHVDGVDVFDGRVVVAAFAILAVVGGDADAFEGSLVYAVDEDALGVLVWGTRGVENDCVYPYEGMGASLTCKKRDEKCRGASHDYGL